MDTTDELQILINEARSKLSPETRQAIDSVNWKLTILEMSKKYNQEQLYNLETETELLLCGILTPTEYQNELEKRMVISKEDVTSLLNEMDKLVFKKIQEALEKIVYKNKKTEGSIINTTPKSINLDPRFNSLPKNIQEAISKSNYQTILYSLANKYKLLVEQMGVLEEITIKVILNTIHPDQYENELISRIKIPKEDISNLVKDINEQILKNIREIMKKDWGDKSSNDKIVTNKQEDEIPLPPYAKKTEIEPIKYAEIIPEKVVETPRAIEKPEPVKPIQEITEIPKNIIEEKLKASTVSNHTVSDYSLPSVNKNAGDETRPKSSDPYREAF